MSSRNTRLPCIECFSEMFNCYLMSLKNKQKTEKPMYKAF